MSDNTLNKALLIMSCDCPRRRLLRARFPLDRVDLLNEESAFDGDVMEAQSAYCAEKKASAARRDGAAPAWQRRQEHYSQHL